MQSQKVPSWRLPLISMAVVLFSISAWAQHYQQTNLVSDIPGLAANTDPQLVNAWGLARSATSPWWVNDNGTGLSTLYNGAGTKQALVVTVPPDSGSAPTGISFNGGTGFVVSNGTTSGPARFIFATEDGIISGWNPTVDQTHAIATIDNSSSAVYKALALATFDDHSMLYAANFTAGKVEVYDAEWKPATVPGGFVDAALPAGYGPFAIHNLGGDLYVTFAKQSGTNDEVHGRGLGFVDKFDSGGRLLMRLQHGPWMNAPWGVAIAPANFGQFSNDVIVGNFGSGQVLAFDPASGNFVAPLLGKRGPLVIDGLWAIAFGGGVPNNGAANALFFTAGPQDESHGLFGTLTAVPER